MLTFATAVTPRRGTRGTTGDSGIGSNVVLDAAMPAGVAVCPSTGRRSAKVPASAANVVDILGIVLYDPATPAPSDDATTNDFSAGDCAEVCDQGEVWAVCENALARGAPIYVRHTANGSGKLQLGALRSDADSATAALAPGLSVIEASDGAGVVKVRCNLPFAPVV